MCVSVTISSQHVFVESQKYLSVVIVFAHRFPTISIVCPSEWAVLTAIARIDCVLSVRQ